MPIGSALLLVALCVGADGDGPAPGPLPLPVAVDPAQPIAPAGGVVSGTTPAAILGPAPISAGNPRLVWGVLDGKLFPDAGRMAPNGEPYNPLFSFDGTMNVWLWPAAGLYGFADFRFWGQRGTPGQTHGNFDYTKREFDLDGGAAWNYYGFLELRIFGYSYNNLNRGISQVIPEGYDDGWGIENRWYLSDAYARLGQDGFNISRATFVSIGCYPSKTMTGVDGVPFTPGLFARAYLTWDIPSTYSYLFGDVQLICQQAPLRPALMLSDIGVAIVPFETVRMFEIRLGSEFQTGFDGGMIRNNSLPYFSVRLNY